MDAVMHNSQLLKGPSLLQCCPPELCSRHTAGRPRRYLQYDPHAVVVESLQFLLELFGTVSPYHTAVVQVVEHYCIEQHLPCLHWQVLTHSPEYSQIPANFLNMLLPIEFVINEHTKVLCCSFIPNRLTIMLDVRLYKLTLSPLPSQEHCVGFLEVYSEAIFLEPLVCCLKGHSQLLSHLGNCLPMTV